MVGTVVEDVVNDILGTYLRELLEPGFSHPFLGLKTNPVPDDLKPIPKNWVEEVQLDGDVGILLKDEQNSQPTKMIKGSFTPQQCKVKLQEALERLGLDETSVMVPIRINAFGKQQLFQEKQRVKHELKRFDSEFRHQADRWPTHCEKETMRPLYIYHRRLRTLIEQSEGRGFGRGHGEDGLGVVWESAQPLDHESSGEKSRRRGLAVGSSRTVEELENRIYFLQQRKNSVRKKLQVYRESFMAENGRSIKYHKDILPIEREYKMYKDAKEDISRLEAQLKDLMCGT